MQERPSHPTLHPGEESVAVITDFARNFVPPMPREGFTQVYVLYASVRAHPDAQTIGTCCQRARTRRS